MTLIVETGTGELTSESYVSVTDCADYASKRGLTFPSSPVDAAEQALRRATQWIDDTYRTRFPGQRRRFRLQALEWPRVAVVDMNGFPIEDDEIPQEVFNATCEAAVRELASAGSLAPDLERGGKIQMLKAGSVEIQYGAGASATTTFQIIDGILASLIGAPNQYTASAVRG